LDITDAQAEELISCFCREVQVPMDYKKFARGRSLYKKSIRGKIKKEYFEHSYIFSINR
jgi:hypothetical protein